METKGRKNAYKRALEHFGGVAALAKALDIERQAVYMWRGKVPQSRAYQIEVLTDGKITADDLLGREFRPPKQTPGEAAA